MCAAKACTQDSKISCGASGAVAAYSVADGPLANADLNVTLGTNGFAGCWAEGKTSLAPGYSFVSTLNTPAYCVGQCATLNYAVSTWSGEHTGSTTPMTLPRHDRLPLLRVTTNASALPA